MLILKTHSLLNNSTGLQWFINLLKVVIKSIMIMRYYTQLNMTVYLILRSILLSYIERVITKFIISGFDGDQCYISVPNITKCYIIMICLFEMLTIVKVIHARMVKSVRT